MARLLFFRHHLGDGNKNLNGKQSHAILIILNKMLEKRYHFVNDDGCGHFFDKLGHVGSSLPADHGSIIMNEKTKLLTELFLNGRRDLAIRGCEESAARYLGRKPVGLGQSNGERDEVLLNLLC